jgi:SAM-dependent methyltransferase
VDGTEDRAPAPWGAAVAARYDGSLGEMAAPAVVAATVDVLVDLAAGGPALELAVGTGRIGLPLAARGVRVHGIELSPAMIEQLRARPGGGDVVVTCGDMATTRLDERFTLVYLVFNTMTNLLTQAEQVACFRNAAEHLRPGGRFVVETFVPQLRRLPPGERFVPFDMSHDHVGVDEYDVAEQRLVSHHTWIRDGRAERFDSPHRYGWPAEYDLMAQLAGMRLEHRWADWDRSPFTTESASHVSVWRTT